MATNNHCPSGPSYNLPREIQARVFSYLDQADFLRASHVSRFWREVAYEAGHERSLDLSGRKLTLENCRALLEVPFSSLRLEGCRLGDREAKILNQSNRWKELRLGYNAIGIPGLKRLSSGGLKKLEVLALDNNKITQGGVKQIAAGCFPALKKLNLNNNKCDWRGATALASGTLSTLEELDIGHNNIRDEGLIALAGGNFPVLRVLDVESNNIRTAGIRALNSGKLAALDEVRFKNRTIPISVLEELEKGVIPEDPEKGAPLEKLNPNRRIH